MFFVFLVQLLYNTRTLLYDCCNDKSTHYEYSDSGSNSDIPGTDTVENQGESVGNSVIEMIIRCPLCICIDVNVFLFIYRRCILIINCACVTYITQRRKLLILHPRDKFDVEVALPI